MPTRLAQAVRRRLLVFARRPGRAPRGAESVVVVGPRQLVHQRAEGTYLSHRTGAVRPLDAHRGDRRTVAEVEHRPRATGTKGDSHDLVPLVAAYPVSVDDLHAVGRGYQPAPGQG